MAAKAEPILDMMIRTFSRIFLIGPDDRTAHNIIRLKNFMAKTLDFGEQIFCPACNAICFKDE